VVSFEELREVHRKERASPKLVALAPTFWKEVADYFLGKMQKYEELRQQTSRFTDKVLGQFEREVRNAGRVISELYTLREKKLLLMAWSEVATKDRKDLRDLTPEERDMYKVILEQLKEGRNTMLAGVLAGEKAEEKEEPPAPEPETQQVRILENVASFLGTDLNLYGPYEPGQLAELPLRYVKLLVDKGKAEIVSAFEGKS